MKPVEYWVCAIRAGEPECWDGPHRTVEAAYESKVKSFNTVDFEVYEVTAKKAPRPKAPSRPRPKAESSPKGETKTATKRHAPRKPARAVR